MMNKSKHLSRWIIVWIALIATFALCGTVWSIMTLNPKQITGIQLLLALCALGISSMLIYYWISLKLEKSSKKQHENPQGLSHYLGFIAITTSIIVASAVISAYYFGLSIATLVPGCIFIILLIGLYFLRKNT